MSILVQSDDPSLTWLRELAEARLSYQNHKEAAAMSQNLSQ